MHNTPSSPVIRRQFLYYSPIGTGATVLPGCVSPRPRVRRVSPNEKLNLVIGVGGRGAAVNSENIVALCDVNDKNLEAAAAKHPRAKKYVLGCCEAERSKLSRSRPVHSHRI